MRADLQHSVQIIRAETTLTVSQQTHANRALTLERQADAELVLGHIAIAERLVRTADELRSAAA